MLPDAPASMQLMTAEQARRLKELARILPDLDAYDETLTAAEAARRIAALEVHLQSESRGGTERFPRT